MRLLNQIALGFLLKLGRTGKTFSMVRSEKCADSIGLLSLKAHSVDFFETRAMELVLRACYGSITLVCQVTTAARIHLRHSPWLGSIALVRLVFLQSSKATLSKSVCQTQTMRLLVSARSNTLLCVICCDSVIY